MNVYTLGHVPWEYSQLIYHSLPRLGLSGLILLSPATPYVCVGYHQSAEQEVDLEYCQQQGIPVFRREVGGGAVYLDGRQLFFQLVLPKDHPLAAGDKADFYQRMLAPVAQTYADLGIPARYRPINDVITAAGRKISGTGAAHMENSVVLVGNLIQDFDYDTMARVLRVPDEKYRDKVHKTLQENLSTIQRELGSVPAEEELTERLTRRFAEVLGPLEQAHLPAAVWARADALRATFLTEEWLLAPSRRAGTDRNVKIATGVHVVGRMRKTLAGLVRAALVLHEERLASVSITGDFFFYPEQALAGLETHLAGLPLAEIEPAIDSFYVQQGIDAPGLPPDLLARILQGIE